MAHKLMKYLGDLEEPVIIGKTGGWFSKGALRVIIIGEDFSAYEHFVKWPKSYVIEILNKSYFLVPKTVLRMKSPTVIYYYNNPFPIGWNFQYSEVTALDLYSGEARDQLPDEMVTYLANIIIDSDTVQLGFNNKFMSGIYNQQTGLSLKNWAFIVGGVLVTVLLFLQLSGKVDIIGNLNKAVIG